MSEESNATKNGFEHHGEELLPRRRSSSVIWAHFGFRASDTQQEVVICKECGRVVPAPQGNTTNLFNHLRTHHKNKHEECIRARATLASQNPYQPTQPKIPATQSLHRESQYSSTAQRHAEITDAIAYYLAKDMCPIDTVSNEGFIKMIKTLDNKYTIPPRNFFSKMALPTLYQKCRGKIEKDILNVDFFAVTTDIWSSRAMEPYLSTSIHFIDGDFEMKSWCLQTSFFPQDNTGEAVAQGLREIITSWSLQEERLVCFTTSSQSNVAKAAALNEWPRLECFGYRVHLAIENAMNDPEIEHAVGVCKKIVSRFSYSYRLKKELAWAQKELKLPEHGLKVECPTRWGSKQAMIERVLEQQKAILKVLSSDQKSRHLVPTWQDIEILDAINKALQPLIEFTEALFSEKYVGLSYVKPVLHLFCSFILKVSHDVPDLTNTMKTKILTYLEEKYEDPGTQELLDMASALDPRFKLTYVTEDRTKAIQSRLLSEMVTSTSMENDPCGETTDTEDAPSMSKKRKSVGSFFKITGEAAQKSSPQQEQQQALAELQSYQQCANLDSEEDPLDWWKEHKRIYPRLSKLAKKYLCIPATNSPSESVINTGGNVVTCVRSSLKPETVDRMVFLAKNL
ncbi:E3 SUMO-protein ligase ZBED1-like [Corythoichthys intestinalis]|uniref:E3 SUMO-protein ligase ZBED1-like n=1 Tax=Corythoichthys intestinalis TaxID=161448 RepID=UPI0025A59E45|nr:E3 SUMO-protein ligase ZBED1-like [Corythoichthys intestinalis]